MSNDKTTSTVKKKTGSAGAVAMMEGGALEKFSIVAFKDENIVEALGVFVASFNPSTFSVNHASSFDEGKATTTGNSAQKFKHRNPRTLSVELFFDGTGTSSSSKQGGVDAVSNLLTEEVKQKLDAAIKKQKEAEESLPPGAPRKNLVDQQVSQFLTICYDIDGRQHKPPFLVFVWGTFYFAGVLESANVSYSLFSSDGSPLRAKITISVKEHISKKKIDQILRLRSPDLTQSRVILAGDTLPNLAKKMYDDESLYLQLAKANGLKNYRKLVPGTQLFFPPIEKLKNVTL